MIPDDFLKWLVAGSYVFSAGSYVFGWRILQALGRIEKELAHARGVIEGQALEDRVTRLETESRCAKEK